MQKNIKLIRKQKGMTQGDLAKATGLSISYISLIEQGKRDPSISTLEKLAAGLGVSLMMIAFPDADKDGLEKVDPELSERVVAYALEQINE